MRPLRYAARALVMVAVGVAGLAAIQFSPAVMGVAAGTAAVGTLTELALRHKEREWISHAVQRRAATCGAGSHI